jgi:hypothetical protein
MRIFVEFRGNKTATALDAKFAELAKFREGERATTKDEADSLRE